MVDTDLTIITSVHFTQCWYSSLTFSDARPMYFFPCFKNVLYFEIIKETRNDSILVWALLMYRRLGLFFILPSVPVIFCKKKHVPKIIVILKYFTSGQTRLFYCFQKGNWLEGVTNKMKKILFILSVLWHYQSVTLKQVLNQTVTQ